MHIFTSVAELGYHPDTRMYYKLHRGNRWLGQNFKNGGATEQFPRMHADRKKDKCVDYASICAPPFWLLLDMDQ